MKKKILIISNCLQVKCGVHTHFNLMLTSIALMKNIEYGGGVYHIDGTHGIVKNRFPLDVFGITDR